MPTASPFRLLIKAVVIGLAMAAASVAWVYFVRPQTPAYVLAVVFAGFLGFGLTAGGLIYWNAKLSQRDSPNAPSIDKARSE